MKFTPTIGADLSGSIGGITASRNRGGNYFKMKSNPIQPNTQAQLRAKANFGAGSKGFGDLTSGEKSGWANYAEVFFSPRNPKTGSVPSGYQAFAAINTLFRNSVTANRTYTVEVNGSVLAGGVTFSPYSFAPTLPIANGGSPNWDNILGNPETIVVTGGRMSVDGNVEMTAQIGNGVSTEMSNFRNGEDSEFGFAVYASNANPSDNMNYARPEQYLMGFFQLPTATDISDLDSVATITIQSVLDFITGEYQSFPLFGTFVNLTLYTVDERLNMSKIGTIEVEVEANF